MVAFDENGVAERIRACEEQVERDPEHFLSFKARRKMLLHFGEPSSPREGLEQPMTEGHRLRGHLALKVAERALPIWTEHHGGDPGDVAVLMEMTRDVVAGRPVDRKRLAREGMELKNHLDGGAPAGPKGFGYVYAGYAMAFAAISVAKGEVLVPGHGATQLDVENPQEHHLYDCAAWGAAAAAGDLPWGDPNFYSASKARDYWHWYLREAVPQAVDDVR